MRFNTIFFKACLFSGALLSTTACSDFLEREPISSVTPDQYFTTQDQFGAYAISHYQGLFSAHGGYNMGIGMGDNNTDNAITGFSNSYFVPGQWKVPEESNTWNFGTIRSVNYFFEKAYPKYESGEVTGGDLEHYVGEMHFLRAWTYFTYLKYFGDFPIITEVLPDKQDVLIEKSVRQPRNLVARFILEELDKAIAMLKDQGAFSNNRINKQVAQLVKSRVALYEASFERYHQGTGRVPGDANWPGKRVHPNFTLDVNAEVDFFLTEAMAAAKAVADHITLTENTGVINPPTNAQGYGFNPYFEMFGQEDLSGVSEVLMWKAYGATNSFTISHGAPAWVQSGSGSGLLKTYMESFLMADGRPWYAASTEAPYMGDKTFDDVKANRDGRLQLFVFGESDFLPYHTQQTAGEPQYFKAHPVSNRGEMKDVTGYRLRKFGCYDQAQNVWGKANSTTGCIIFRGAEAYLNYMEACYMKNNRLDADADKYWRAIRRRAKVAEDYNVTIANTDMSKETDFAKYSGDQLVDATLLNIRRERRCEFIGEDMRWNDLMRWRSMDQMLTHKFIPEGCNMWDGMYKNVNKDENGAGIKYIYLGSKADGDNGYFGTNDAAHTPNISSPDLSKYIRPHSTQDKSKEQLFDGCQWSKANYLYPVPIKQMILLSPDGTVDNSVIYQNPYWPTQIGAGALE